MVTSAIGEIAFQVVVNYVNGEDLDNIDWTQVAGAAVAGAIIPGGGIIQKAQKAASVIKANQKVVSQVTRLIMESQRLTKQGAKLKQIIIYENRASTLIRSNNLMWFKYMEEEITLYVFNFTIQEATSEIIKRNPPYLNEVFPPCSVVIITGTRVTIEGPTDLLNDYNNSGHEEYPNLPDDFEYEYPEKLPNNNPYPLQ